MINFNSKIDEFLPYNRNEYIDFNNWYGVSFQLNNENINLINYVSKYEFFINKVIEQFKDSLWVINHDDKDLPWFPNSFNNLNSLRTLFKENNIPNSFTGGFLVDKENLLRYIKDLLLYPYSVMNKENLLYKNIDISNYKVPFIIKITGHLNIDLLSTEKIYLKKIIEEEFSENFIIKTYRGTNL